MVEQGTHKPLVASSNLALGTKMDMKVLPVCGGLNVGKAEAACLCHRRHPMQAAHNFRSAVGSRQSQVPLYYVLPNVRLLFHNARFEHYRSSDSLLYVHSSRWLINSTSYSNDARHIGASMKATTPRAGELLLSHSKYIFKQRVILLPERPHGWHPGHSRLRRCGGRNLLSQARRQPSL